jgi:hypothetical protein
VIDDSDVEEITPPVILNDPATCAMEILSQPPPLPLLDESDLEDKGLQVGWEFRTDWGQAVEVAEALHKIVRVQHWKQEPMNLWVQGRVSGMLALCHLFSHPGSNSTWTEASELAAQAMGHGPTFAHNLRHCVIAFERQDMDYMALPLTQHG